MFVLRHWRDGEMRAVILDGISVARARMAWLAPEIFLDERAIDEISAARLPQWAVGRVLTRRELTAVVAGEKKPPAPSARRRRGPAPRHVNSNVFGPIPALGDE